LSRKSSAQKTIDPFRIHYNFIREHSSIKKTPAEQSGIRLDLGQNKIENLIKLATKNRILELEENSLHNTIRYKPVFELIVFFTSFKYIFVEGGEQALVGIDVASRIGLRQTLKITAFGFAVGIILYFVFLKTAGFVPTNILEIALGIGLLFFSGIMFKEFFEDETKIDTTKHKLAYFYMAMIEAVENSVALATFSLIEITSALAGFFVAIGLIIGLLRSGIVKKVPLRITRLIAGILLTSTAIPLIIYGLNIPSPEILHWLIPPLH